MNIKLLLAVNLIAVIACDQIVVNHSTNDADQTGKRSQRKGKKTRRNKKKEKWVVDSIFYDDYQADGPTPTETYDFCPPVPDVVDEGACAQDACKSDMDCDKSYRCCFNGCAYSCLYEVQPAPVVDWLKEPRRSRSGISWLLPDKKPVTDEGQFGKVDTTKKARVSGRTKKVPRSGVRSRGAKALFKPTVTKEDTKALVKPSKSRSARGPPIEELTASKKDERLVPKHEIGQSLQELIDKGSCFNESHAKFLSLNVLDILEYLQTRRIVHSYINPTKIVFDRKGYPCLTGYDKSFTSGYLVPRRRSHAKSQIEYTSPEELLNDILTVAADVFSLGVLSFRLVYGRTPHKGSTHRQTKENILNENFIPNFEPDGLLTKVGKRFLVNCIRKDIDKRFSVKGLKNKFLKDVEWFNEYDPTTVTNRTFPSPFYELLKDGKADQ